MAINGADAAFGNWKRIRWAVFAVVGGPALVNKIGHTPPRLNVCRFSGLAFAVLRAAANQDSYGIWKPVTHQSMELPFKRATLTKVFLPCRPGGEFQPNAESPGNGPHESPRAL